MALNTADAGVRPFNTRHRSVFISHARANFKLADEVRQLLEERGTSCWIAPRDIPASSSYGEEISKALDACSVTVLILTEQSNASKPVSNEIEMSFSKQKPIIPLRLRDVKPSKMLEFYVSNAQWIDAFFSPLKLRVEEIIRIVQAVEAGVPPSPPKPESKTFVGKAERYLEQTLRHKMLTGVLAFVVLFGVGATSTFNAMKMQAVVDADKAAIAQDPSTLGLVKLSAASDLGNAAKEGALAIGAAVYLNVKGATFKDAQLVAAVETDTGGTQNFNLAQLLALDSGADAQSGVFQIPVSAKRITVCLTAKHPSLKEDYTAQWSYNVRAKADVLDVVRDGTPLLSKGIPSICHS